MRNAEIALAFDELGDLYELDGAVVYRVVAYRNAAKAIREAGVSVAELAKQGRATELAGVGKTIAEKIDVLLETGAIPSATKLKAKFPPGLVEVTRIPGLGPKRTRVLFDELGVDSLDSLKQAAESQRIRTLKGFGPKAEESILLALEAGVDGSPKARILLSQALRIAEGLRDAIAGHPAADRVEIAGSARRMAETCKDLDLIATAHDASALAKAFAKLPLLAEASVAAAGGVTPSGAPRAVAGVRAVTHDGVAVDFRIVPPENFGNLLQHFTGSGKHNEALRTEAVKAGFHVSEYGVTDDSTETTHACATEEEVYELLGMQYIEPEMRENRGELQAARKHELPELIRVEDIRGELHCHSTKSDGRQTIEQMAEAARARGYSYMAITDHSASHGFGNHVTPDELRATIEEVRALNERWDDFTLLAGSEVNIDTDGSLDYEDDLLAELDWVIGSMHTSFRMKEGEMTRRMIAAMEHPLVDAIGHPTGRLINRREPYGLDIEKIVEAAIRTGTFLEINANPNRRDLDENNARYAVEAGAMLVIDSDAHGTDTLGNIAYGVATARRGWVTAARVANTREWPELDALRKRGRS